MAEQFRFSPRPNRANEIEWRSWGSAAFDEADQKERLVFLNLTTGWCHWCHRMDEETYSHPGVIRQLNEDLVPIRVDADILPHVRDRYIADGWPTNAFVTPTGEVLWSGTYVGPDRFRAVLDQVLEAWEFRRDNLEEEIARRRKAMSASRGRRSATGLVRREAADDVMTVLQDGFDARNGGFGDELKFPDDESIELLYVQGVRSDNSDWIEMADRTLDGMLAGELLDRVEGGFFRYATRPDWTEPRYEKLLVTQAEVVRSCALGACLRQRDDWRSVVEETVAWVDDTLALPEGLWSGSQDADPEYFGLSREERASRESPRVDDVVFTDANASWIRALAEAGGRLENSGWSDRAATALEQLLERHAAPDDLLYHYRRPGEDPSFPRLLIDILETARACMAVAQSTGRAEYLEHARRLASAMEAHFWADEGGFVDHIPQDEPVAALRYTDRPFDLNAGAARLLVDLSLGTGERSVRGLAERILAFLSPVAGRYGVAAAGFALGVEEFFEPPLRLVLAGSPAETAALRHAALALRVPSRRVFTLPEGGTLGPLSFDASAGPAAFACGSRSCSDPVHEPEALADAAEALS